MNDIGILQEVVCNSKDRTIPRFYMYRFTSRLSFYVPILVIYFIAVKMNLTQISILIAAYGFMTTIFSTPPISVVAKKIGSRKMLMIGELLKGTSVGIIFFSEGIGHTLHFSHFIVLLIAQLVGGVGYSFCAGSDGSFLFSYCKATNKMEEYKQHEAKSSSLVFLSFLGAGVIGGIVSIFNIKLPFLLTLPAHMICALLVFTFKDVTIEINTQKGEKSNLLSELKNPILVSNMLFYSVSRALIMTLSVSILPLYFFKDLKLSIALFGIIFGSYTLTGFFVGKTTIIIREKLTERRFSLFLVICMLSTLALLYFVRSIFVIAAPLLMYVMTGAIRPHSMTRINAAIKHDKNRAAIISLAEAAFGILNVLMVLGSFAYLQISNIYEIFKILFVSAAVLYSLLFVVAKGNL